MILLTKERKALGLSQAKLAQRADLHPSTISNIETGNLRPWNGQVEKIESAMKDMGWNGKGNLFEVIEK